MVIYLLRISTIFILYMTHKTRTSCVEEVVKERYKKKTSFDRKRESHTTSLHVSYRRINYEHFFSFL